MDRIRTGNKRDRAQTVSDIVSYLEEQELSKKHGSIKRLFAVSEKYEDPRIGLQNASSMQNRLIKMACYDASRDVIVCSDIACLCQKCMFGQFSSCINYTHRLIDGKISDSKTSSKAKEPHYDFTIEEQEFNQYAFDWAQKLDTDNLTSEKSWFTENSSDEDDSNNQDNGSKVKTNVTSEEKLNDSRILIDDDDDEDFWVRCKDFKKHLEDIFENLTPDKKYLDTHTSTTIEKLELTFMDEAWTAIQMETGNENDFQLWRIRNQPIGRSHLQQCGGPKWFTAEMIDLGLQNIQFRRKIDNQKLVILNCNFFYYLKVSFEFSRWLVFLVEVQSYASYSWYLSQSMNKIIIFSSNQAGLMQCRQLRIRQVTG